MPTNTTKIGKKPIIINIGDNIVVFAKNISSSANGRQLTIALPSTVCCGRFKPGDLVKVTIEKL